MKHMLFALFFSVSALAQAPSPVITAVTPGSGPDSGGTAVAIFGNNLHTPVACLLPCPPRVGFGETFVDAVEISDHQLSVTTPAHAAGVVNLTIAIPGRDTVVVQNGFTFTAGPESQYDRVLLPIYLKDVVPGAHGTLWATDFWLYNGGTTSVGIADRVCPPPQVCPPVFPLPLFLEAKHSLHNPADFFPAERGNFSQILYISNQGAADVSMGLRVADISRNALNGGTDLPVIRDGEFLTRTSQLLNVPLDNQGFRILLRVYEMNYGDARFAVRFYPASEDASSSVYNAVVTAKSQKNGPFRPEAAYGELDITPLLNLRLAWPQNARIEIEPLTPGSEYWALISLTNNATQLVTLVTPQ